MTAEDSNATSPPSAQGPMNLDLPEPRMLQWRKPSQPLAIVDRVFARRFERVRSRHGRLIAAIAMKIDRPIDPRQFARRRNRTTYHRRPRCREGRHQGREPARLGLHPGCAKRHQRLARCLKPRLPEVGNQLSGSLFQDRNPRAVLTNACKMLCRTDDKNAVPCPRLGQERAHALVRVRPALGAARIRATEGRVIVRPPWISQPSVARGVAEWFRLPGAASAGRSPGSNAVSIAETPPR